MDLFRFSALAGIALLSFALSFLGAAVGLVLGHVRLPLLIAYLGSPVAGASTNLAISGLGALAATFRHFRDGRVSLAVLALMGIPSAVGAILGILLFIKVNRFAAHLVLGVVLLLMGINMLRAPAAIEEERGEARLSAGMRLLGEAAIGLLLGLLASATGLMMSSLRLPMMIRVLKIDARVAVGSNMAIGFLTALVGALTSWKAGGGFDWLVLAAVGPPTMLGSYLGARLTGRLRKETVRRLLGWTIAVMGLMMIVQGGWRATRGRDYQPPARTPVEVQELRDEEDEWPESP